MINPATAVFAFCSSTIPPKDKIGICVVCDSFLFMLFNSKPTGYKPAIIKVEPCELCCLKHASYLDTATLMPYEKEHLEDAVRKNNIWPVPSPLKERIKFAVNQHGALRRDYERIVSALF